jgi:hypothetical protein
MLDRDGGLELAPAGGDWKPNPSLPTGMIRHTAIRKGDDFNSLLTVVRGRHLEVYVNGVAVCNPIVLDRDVTPGGPNPSLISQGFAKAEFERITVWSAEGVPTPAERLAKGQAIVASTTPFAWPPAALHEGRIALPDTSKAKVLYLDEFTDPKTNWPQGKWGPGDFCLRGYDNGKFFIQHDAGGGTNWGGPAVSGAAFVCLVEGRVTGPASNRWALAMVNDKKQCALNVKIDGSGKLEVAFHDGRAYRSPSFFSGTHAKIKAAKEFNALTVALRGRRLEVYMNGAAICDPIVLDFDLEPTTLRLGLEGDNCRAEFERMMVWSIEGVPTPEERLAKGDLK